VSDKIKLAPGQESAVYDFKGGSFAELGAKLDEFYAALDHNHVATSGSPGVSCDINVLRSWQNGVERVTIGNYYATETIYRRGTAE
jgi:hypothetical protein